VAAPQYDAMHIEDSSVKAATATPSAVLYRGRRATHRAVPDPTRKNLYTTQFITSLTCSHSECLRKFDAWSAPPLGFVTAP